MHNWLYIGFLVSLPAIFSLCCVLCYCFRSSRHQDQDADTGYEGDGGGSGGGREVERHPVRIPRGFKPDKPILKNNAAVPPGPKNPDNQAHHGDDFLNDFDKRHARRKVLQKQNDEKLRELLQWKSPYDNYQGPSKILNKTKKAIRHCNDQQYDKIQRIQSQREGLRNHQIHNSDSSYTNRVNVDDDREWMSVKEEDSKLNNLRRRHSDGLASSDSPRQPAPAPAPAKEAGVTKVINFVAIKSQNSAPDYKPRNKIQSQPKSSKVDIPPARPRSRENKKNSRPKILKVSEHHFEDEANTNEAEGVRPLPQFTAEEVRAVTVFNDRLDRAAASFVETRLHIENTPPKVRRLEFSEYKRNFLTDSLFAGNIYVGGQVNAENITGSNDDEAAETGTSQQQSFSSWRDSFKRKLSS